MRALRSTGRFFKGVLKEAKRVRWTTRKDLLKYSGIALIFATFFALFMVASSGLLALLLDWVNYYGPK
jgi:preprotein translocase SecE subunit